MTKRTLLALAFCIFASIFAVSADKPPITLEEYMNAVSFRGIRISPDGRAVVIATSRPDWEQDYFRRDLWLYRDGPNSGQLVQLTQSGHDSDPEWSPDGRWIAFLSDRKPADKKSKEEEKEEPKTHLYLMSAEGGEAFPITEGEEAVHAFAWAPDSRAIYFATREPWSKAKRDAYKKEWKDVVQYRAAERGDAIARLELAVALANRANAGKKEPPAGDKEEKEKEKETGATPGAVVIANTPLKVRQMQVSPDARRLAFITDSISSRVESPKEYDIFLVDLTLSGVQQPRPVTANANEAIEQNLRWSPDGRRLFFTVQSGSVEGKYENAQPRVYSVDVTSGALTRWAPAFPGAINDYSVAADGSLVTIGQVGTEAQMYTTSSPTAELKKQTGWPGTYEEVSAAAHSPRIAFIYSSAQRPTEVYLADSAAQLQAARPITAFNKIFTERALPQAKPFRWTSDDGASVEGMLFYPPGKFEAKNLPMLTLIHGGPASADGDQFYISHNNYVPLAATQGWLVFKPNYRGSTGYGDDFERQIAPHLVSKPGRDILTGVDALVKAGIADPNRLTVGGYSYGGYMTNWLITQTDRFKAAVTGAGAVEHVANWGNDDLTFDDAWYLGGTPWEVPKMYQEEAAIFYMPKVKTPTHMVSGGDDIRVAVLESYLMDRALHTLGVPSTLLIFPGEGHPLSKNPWHAKIKVREELKWLEKYGGLAR